MWEYCSKSDVASYTGFSEDKLKDSWSSVVEGLIDEHTGLHYGDVTQYTESYDGNGSDMLALVHRPIVSVASLSIDDVSIGSTEYVVYSSGYIRLVSGSPSGALEKALGSTSARFPVGEQNIDIVYTAHSSTVPAYVRLAAILMVSEMAMVAERAGADGSLAVSRAVQRAGESERSYRRSFDISGRLRAILSNTIGEKWRFR